MRLVRARERAVNKQDVNRESSAVPSLPTTFRMRHIVATVNPSTKPNSNQTRHGNGTTRWRSLGYQTDAGTQRHWFAFSHCFLAACNAASSATFASTARVLDKRPTNVSCMFIAVGNAVCRRVPAKHQPLNKIVIALPFQLNLASPDSQRRAASHAFDHLIDKRPMNFRLHVLVFSACFAMMSAFALVMRADDDDR